VHIDFGFVLGQSPGNMNFERAPFKLTPELAEVMDGPSSPLFAYFRALFVRGMQAARDHADMLLQLVDMARAGGAVRAGPVEISGLDTDHCT
jgi:phosphatidylinositol 4-kinase